MNVSQASEQHKRICRVAFKHLLKRCMDLGVPCCSTASNVFFFSLFHQRADDEALTRLLQTSLFLVASPILVKSIFFLFQVFPDIVHPGLPLSTSASLSPSTYPCKAAFGSLFPSIRSTCPNHCTVSFF